MDKNQELIDACEKTWRNAYHRFICEEHGVVGLQQLAPKHEPSPPMKVCPRCHQPVTTELIEPSAEQRGRH